MAVVRQRDVAYNFYNMGRYIGPKNKLARRFGVNLGLKSNAAKVARRLAQPPGVHGPKKKTGGFGRGGSGFGKQLLEKQKAKIIYGLRERQFEKYVREATRVKGNSGVMLQQLLEMRLDNVVYRAGIAITRAQARQMVTHGMFTVNEKRLNIPSHIVCVGDVVGIKLNKAKKKLFENLTDTLSKKEPTSWLVANPAAKTVKVVSRPAEGDVERSFDVKLIIEFYSSR